MNARAFNVDRLWTLSFKFRHIYNILLLYIYIYIHNNNTNISVRGHSWFDQKNILNRRSFVLQMNATIILAPSSRCYALLFFVIIIKYQVLNILWPTVVKIQFCCHTIINHPFELSILVQK